MFKWMIDNKEWLFSGIGLATIGAVYALVRRFIFRKKKPNEVPPFNSTVYKLRPYPKEIISEIDGTPPYQQEMKREFYVGLKFQWHVTLYSARKNNDGLIDLLLRDRGNYPWVTCIVNPENYPELKVSHKNKKIIVAGEIQKIEPNIFILKDVKLHFL